MSFNPAVFSIRNRLLILLVIIGTIVAGMAAYGSLPRFEDPEFTIRRAVVVTPYPGGSPMEVATEVTQRLEREIGQMQEVKEIVSTSEAGQSRIEVEIKYEKRRAEATGSAKGPRDLSSVPPLVFCEIRPEGPL